MEKWVNEFPEQELKLSQFYQTIFICTTDVKLRNFQYKNLMRIIPNNKYLFKCKLVPSVLCDFCSMYDESNAHLFWECRHVHELWSKIQNILTNNNLENQLNCYNISFGISFEGNLKGSVFNFIVLLAKYYVFSSKYKQEIPTIDGFQLLLEKNKRIRKNI